MADKNSGVSVNASDHGRLRADLFAALSRARNADGGWAYSSGKRSRIEPTCWALLALSQASSESAQLDVLSRWPRNSNWLIDISGAPPNHAFNAIAALTLLQSASTELAAEPIVRRLIASKPVTFGPDPVVRQDSTLEAWSWTDGTFSWVEPTAWCVLLLKQRLARGPYPDAARRVHVGEQMLIDRAIRGGGWNYGNANVYGKELPPYVQTTALALLALQNQQSEPAVSQGLERLQRDVLTDRS